ncbi:serine protease [Parasphingorhabdus pacifica]
MFLGGLAALALSVGAAPAVANADVTEPADDPSTLIVGGHDATEQYDWMASLQSGGQHGCGGSLVDSEWVLTAAHCVQQAQAADLGLRIGSPDHSTGGTQTGVSEIVVHPGYETDAPNADLALLKLDREVAETPIPIADASGAAGTPSRIIGWGLTCPVRGCGEPPAQLQELDTSVVPDAACTLSSIDAGTEICTGSGQLLTNACFGDSGGPQLEGTSGNWQLTGITSRLGSIVPVCGTAPSVYTDATAYKSWITERVAG